MTMAHSIKELSVGAAHAFVSRNRNARWEGYDIVQWHENPRAFTASNGKFRRDMPSGRGWGFETRTPVDSDGKWRIRVNTR